MIEEKLPHPPMLGLQIRIELANPPTQGLPAGWIYLGICKQAVRSNKRGHFGSARTHQPCTFKSDGEPIHHHDQPTATLVAWRDVTKGVEIVLSLCQQEIMIQLQKRTGTGRIPRQPQNNICGLSWDPSSEIQNLTGQQSFLKIEARVLTYIAFSRPNRWAGSQPNEGR